MESKKHLIPLLFLGTIILSFVAIVPAFSATGTVRFSDGYGAPIEWARQGAQIGLVVEDPDLNIVLEVTGERQTVSNGRFRVENVPIVDSNGDTFINELDVNVAERNAAGSTLDVDRVNVDGRVDLVDSTYSGEVLVSYWGSGFGDTSDRVSVKSQADPIGFIVTLYATSPGSGILRLVIDTNADRSDTNSNPPNLKVGKDDVITLTYMDADPPRTISKRLNVETTPPAFSKISPAHNSSNRANTEVVFDVTDTDSRSGLL